MKLHAVQLNANDEGPAQLTVTGAITAGDAQFGLGFAIARAADPDPVDEATVKWLAVDFVAADGAILLTTVVPARPVCAIPDLDKPPSEEMTFFIDSLVPLVEDVRAMVVRDEERVFVKREFASDPPVIEGVSVKAIKPGSYTVSWSARHPSDAELEHLVMVSEDGGETWRPTTLPVTTTSVEVFVAPASGVKTLLFGVVTTDGLNTVSATAEPIDAIPVPPQVAILSPAGGTVLSPVMLVACTTEPAGVPSERMSWMSSIDGQIAKGASAVAALSAGDHTITVSLLDESAKSIASDSVDVVVA